MGVSQFNLHLVIFTILETSKGQCLEHKIDFVAKIMRVLAFPISKTGNIYKSSNDIQIIQVCSQRPYLWHWQKLM